MLFYLAAIGIFLVGWMLLTIFVPTASVVNISVFGLLTFVVILIAVRHSYDVRNRKKEIYFAISLILIYYLRSYIRTFIMGGYNALFDLVFTQLNNRGITKINIETSDWKMTSTGNTIFEMMIFFVGAILAYVFTESMNSKEKGKDIFGTLVAGLGAALFMTFSYLLLLPYVGSVYNTTLFEGATVKVPPIELPTVRVQSQPGNRSPLPGWDTWLPLLIIVVVIVYFMFFVKHPLTKAKPAANAPAKRDTRAILLVALILALALVVVIFKPVA
jgi:hypothetical protein